MKLPTIKIYKRINTKGDRLVLNIRYTYDRKSHPFPVGYTIRLKDWDDRKGAVLKSDPNFIKINDALKNLEMDLTRIANKSLEEEKEPTVEYVKDRYSNFIRTRNLFQEIDAKAKPANIESAKILRGQIEELQLQIKRLEAMERKCLRFAGMLPKAQPVEETSDYTIIETFVKEFFKVKTKNEPWAPVKTTFKSKSAKSSGTAKNLRNWCKTFLEFNKSGFAKKYKIKLDFSVLDENYYNAYTAFLTSKSGKDYYNNTAGAHIKKVKYFFRWISKNKSNPVDKRFEDFKFLSEEKEIICFSKLEIDLLYKYKPNEPERRKKKDLQKYIDFTVFSFFTGLRISDVKKANGLRKENGFLVGKTTKTKNQFKVPLKLDPRIEEILNKYDWDLNLFSDVEYNRTIKEILAEFCKSDESLKERLKPITIFRYKLDKELAFTHSFSELYSSHCNRRGFVCYTYSLGFDVTEIMEMIGTKSEKEIKKYLKLEGNHLTKKLERIRKRELEMLTA